ncbi:hypothetical protein [Helicobacter ailurogastricus]|uniref:hypothetical protein n=1 Tax=Helicobacter ailurogastricus TaxID=1578720 RepID=UPI0022C0F56E|nr:hypothetical protein [Helicobacter ailurogastricus]GLH57991.1 hypothetical protein NHP214376_07790 [Helicobacter ailurogastricus]GLH59028.1 hypothetical protein NHP214377_02920 [Helicobacter ailurogastricus]
MDFLSLPEEPLKNAIREHYFKGFICSGDKIDFRISTSPTDLFNKEPTPLLWAEAKAGTYDLNKALTQLVLTILKHQHETLPPFLGAFNGACFGVLEIQKLEPLLKELSKKTYKEAPSNHNSKEFKEVESLLSPLLKAHLVIFAYQQHTKELKDFIQSLHSKPALQTQITRENFKDIFDKWLICVKPSINLDWEQAQKVDILEADFYLADLLSQDNHTLLDLSTLLRGDHYEFNEKVNPLTKALNVDKTGFNDHQEAHKAFWKLYKRPPEKEYRHRITNRRDLLVGKREFRGAFYTPRIWADKSKEYLKAILGQDYENDYILWDLAAGTGNLLVGLDNPYKVYASTIDPSDIKIMKVRAKDPSDPLKIAPENIFRFDFLRHGFFGKSTDQDPKLPESLQAILKDPKQLSKLIIYINPPYAEAGSKTQMSGTGANKDGVAGSEMATKYAQELGKAKNEVFAQFFMRIIKEIAGGAQSEEKQGNETLCEEKLCEEKLCFSPQKGKPNQKEPPLQEGAGSYQRWYHTNLSPLKESLMYNTRLEPLPCLDMGGSLEGSLPLSQGRLYSTQTPLKPYGPILASFSTLKYLNSSNFKAFREHFNARFLGGFMCPGNSFDNVKGEFPIGFLCWDLGAKEPIEEVRLDIYNASGERLGMKEFRALDNVENLNAWIRRYDNKKVQEIWGYIQNPPPDIQHTNLTCVWHKDESEKRHHNFFVLNAQSLLIGAVYFSVRHCTPHTWINHNDQFYAPYNDTWQADTDFLGSCLVFMLFHGKNRISTQYGANHFIPFTEKEVNPKGSYIHHTLLNFLSGKDKALLSGVLPPSPQKKLFAQPTPAPMQACPTFTAATRSVLEAGRKLYRHYHSQERSNPNASLYDIKEFFSGRDGRGKLNPPHKAKDPHYKELYATLKVSLDTLAQELQPKVYAYGFLR